MFVFILSFSTVTFGLGAYFFANNSAKFFYLSAKLLSEDYFSSSGFVVG